MRKAVSLLMIILLSALLVCGCSGKDTSQNNQDYSEGSENGNEEVDLSAYKKPAEAVSIDLSKDDPSNDDMRFVFDDEGKVSQCYYKVGDQQVYVNYTYKEGIAQIYAFMDDVLVADETIRISEYSAKQGFVSIEGYYFKGVSTK